MRSIFLTVVLAAGLCGLPSVVHAETKAAPAAKVAATPTPAGQPPVVAPAPKETKKLTPQQQKMKDCNAEAKTKALKGAERKAFMKECLSAKPK